MLWRGATYRKNDSQEVIQETLPKKENPIPTIGQGFRGKPGRYSIVAFWITTSVTGRSPGFVFVLPILSTTSMPSMTLPKAGCRPSRKLLFTRLMKNWLPPVFGPAFAIEMVPRSFLLPGGNSSFIVYPGPPVPFPFGSPPCIMKPLMTRWKMMPL